MVKPAVEVLEPAGVLDDVVGVDGCVLGVAVVLPTPGRFRLRCSSTLLPRVSVAPQLASITIKQAVASPKKKPLKPYLRATLLAATMIRQNAALRYPLSVSDRNFISRG